MHSSVKVNYDIIRKTGVTKVTDILLTFFFILVIVVNNPDTVTVNKSLTYSVLSPGDKLAVWIVGSCWRHCHTCTYGYQNLPLCRWISSVQLILRPNR